MKNNIIFDHFEQPINAKLTTILNIIVLKQKLLQGITKDMHIIKERFPYNWHG